MSLWGPSASVLALAWTPFAVLSTPALAVPLSALMAGVLAACVYYLVRVRPQRIAESVRRRVPRLTADTAAVGAR